MPDTPHPACPFCRRQRTLKLVESGLSEIHVCRDCHKTFTLKKPARPLPLVRQDAELGAGVNEHHCASVLPMRAQKRTSVSRSAARSRLNRSSSAAYRSIVCALIGTPARVKVTHSSSMAARRSI